MQRIGRPPSMLRYLSLFSIRVPPGTTWLGRASVHKVVTYMLSKHPEKTTGSILRATTSQLKPHPNCSMTTHASISCHQQQKHKNKKGGGSKCVPVWGDGRLAAAAMRAPPTCKQASMRHHAGHAPGQASTRAATHTAAWGRAQPAAGNREVPYMGPCACLCGSHTVCDVSGSNKGVSQKGCGL